MNKKTIEKMLENIDAQYISEAINMTQKHLLQNRKSIFLLRKKAIAAILCVILIGMSLTAVAATSDFFYKWLTNTFSNHAVTKVEIKPQATEDIEKSDLLTEQNSYIDLPENIAISGTKESFVYQYHINNDEITIEQIYSIQDNGLEKLPSMHFEGSYDNAEFSFDYAILNEEIFGYNLTGAINQVFHAIDHSIIYVNLMETDDDVITKGCIAQLDLKTGSVTKLTNDQTIGNMIMSPHGKIILINYRADGYWTAFDIASRTEKKITEINGYARSNEIAFQDDYHVLTFGENSFEENQETIGAKLIDLHTGEITAAYPECGYPNPEWLYQQKDNQLTIRRINGDLAISIDDVKGNPHLLSSRGDYVLLGNLEDENQPLYLCNLVEKYYLQMDFPVGLEHNLELYIAAKENKILLFDGKEAYLADISR